MKPVKTWILAVLRQRSPRLFERLSGQVLPDHVRRTRCLFIHIPKAAGSSVSMSLYGRQIGHHDWRYWRTEYPASTAELFSFSVVRDPFQRFISAFGFLRSGGMNPRDAAFGSRYLEKHADSSSWAESLIDYELQNIALDYPHFRPQFEFVRDVDWNIGVELVIPLEFLDTGLEEVGQKIGQSLSVKRLNPRSQTNAHELSPRAREILSSLYRDDFKLHTTALQRFSTSVP